MFDPYELQIQEEQLYEKMIFFLNKFIEDEDQRQDIIDILDELIEKIIKRANR